MPVLPPIAQSLLILLAPFALLLAEGKKFRQIPLLLGLQAKNFPWQLVQGIKLFALTFAALLAQAIALGLAGVSDTEKVVGILQQQSGATLFAIVFIAPIGEELLFRGYLQKKIASLLGKHGSDYIAVLLSGVVFALLHAGFGSISELAGAFTAAVIFGFYVSEKKVIIPTIVAHALVNLYAVAIAFLVK